jgi:adenylyltransferase/sulfurtransferase
VLGILPGLVGVIQATEVIKLILGKGEPLIGRLLLVDALNMRFRELKLRKNPECPVCGENPTVTALIDYQHFCGIVPETPATSEGRIVKNGIPQLTVKELKARIDTGENVQLIDVREPYEYQIAQIGGKLIPQNDVPNRLAEIDRDREVVVHCRSGARSQHIAEFLVQSGYPKVVNLAGGILAWSDESTPRSKSTEELRQYLRYLKDCLKLMKSRGFERARIYPCHKSSKFKTALAAKGWFSSFVSRLWQSLRR